jgi:hypothetical protein
MTIGPYYRWSGPLPVFALEVAPLRKRPGKRLRKMLVGAAALKQPG